MAVTLMEPPNGLRVSCAAPIDRGGNPNEICFQNAHDLARREAASATRACSAAAVRSKRSGGDSRQTSMSLAVGLDRCRQRNEDGGWRASPGSLHGLGHEGEQRPLLLDTSGAHAQ